MKRENTSNVGKWDKWYKNLEKDTPSSFIYGDTVTYKKSVDFLSDCPIVEDWGVGAGGFLRYRKDAIGVDGSDTCFATKKNTDLTTYTTKCDGIFIRHVLEHNYGWTKILENALSSARNKVCIVLFIPFSNTETQEIRYDAIGVPDLSLSKDEFFSIVIKHNPKNVDIEDLNTATQYGKETLIKITLKELS